MNEYYSGDIWTMQTASGSTQEVLVVKPHEKYATILLLTEKELQNNYIKVKSKSIMYADHGRISYAFYDRFTDFVKQVNEQDFEKIQKQVAESLGVGSDFWKEPVNITAPESKAGNTENQQQPKEEQQIPKICVVESESVRNLQIQLAKAEAERDVYKELYCKMHA